VRIASRELLLEDDNGPGSSGGLPAVPGPGLRWAAPGRAHAIRRTWLDTFDWRLYRAGLILQQAAAGGVTEVVLTDADGTEIAAARPLPAWVRWPALAAALPQGPLRQRVAAAAGVRALLPVARAISSVSEQRVVNADDKIVATVRLDRMPAAAARPAILLTVSPLRGYQREADRVARALRGSGMRCAGQPAAAALEVALAAAGRRPASYTGKVDVVLDPGMPAGAAVAAILTALLDIAEANVPGTLRDLDTEFLHDLRVAVRRSRTLVKLAGDVLPCGTAGRFRADLRWLGNLTTPVRDLDVYLLGFDELTGRLVAAAPADLQPFRDRLALRRAAERRRLVSGLRSARFSRFATQWRAALTGASGGLTVPAAPTAGRLAAARISRAHRRVLRDGAALTGDSPPQDLHDLRKRCKELRYLLEMFASLYDPAEYRGVLRDLRKLQDCLGEFQDSQVQREEIVTLAGQMMASRSVPAATLLAMGEVAATVAARQGRARAEFATAFAAFASPGSRSRLRALVAAPGGAAA
jgi:CHAD domain-containing protein